MLIYTCGPCYSVTATTSICSPLSPLISDMFCSLDSAPLTRLSCQLNTFLSGMECSHSPGAVTFHLTLLTPLTSSQMVRDTKTHIYHVYELILLFHDIMWYIIRNMNQKNHVVKMFSVSSFLSFLPNCGNSLFCWIKWK